MRLSRSDLHLPCPSAFPLMLVGQHGNGARLAADGCDALLVQLVRRCTLRFKAVPSILEHCSTACRFGSDKAM